MRRTYEYGNYVSFIDYVTYTKVIGTRDDKEPDQNLIPQNLRDRAVTCQTSGIVTKTGILHVLEGGHRLFFNQQSLGN